MNDKLSCNLHSKLRKVTSMSVAKVFTIALMFVAVVLPLFFILAELGTVDFIAVISSSKFLSALGNSVSVSIVTALLSITFSFTLAYLISRSNCRFKSIFAVAITVPMLIPSISHGTGLVLLFGENGIITNMFGVSSSIYGFTGVMIGSFMYSFPVAFLMFTDVLKYEDRMVYDVADIMGIPKWRQFIDITLPYLRRPLISIFFAVFTMVFTDYGVAMMVGGRFETLPLFMYNEVIGQLNYGVGAVVSLVLVLPAGIACVFDMCNKDSGNHNTVNKAVINRSTKRFNVITYVVCGISLVIVALPIIAFCMIGFVTKYPVDNSFSFINFVKVFEMGLFKHLGNSLVIAMLTSLIGVGLSYTVAYFAARSNKGVLSKSLHIVSLSSLAIPGVVLGIAYSIMYGGSGFASTIFILVLVNIVHFFSSSYLLAYNAFGKINANYEVVSKTLNVSRFRFVLDVLIPETGDTILEMFSYFFVNSMVTISAVSFLANANTNPLALLINQLERELLTEAIAIVSMVILFINVCVKLSIYGLKRLRSTYYAK